MSLLFLDSFDDRTSNMGNKYTSSSSSATFLSSGGRTGNAVLMNSGPAFMQKSFSARATFVAGFALEMGSLTTAARLIEYLDGATSQIYVQQNAGSTLSVVRGDGTVLGTTVSSSLLSTSVYHYLEFKATIHNTAGSFELRVDGVNVSSASGVNTRNSTNNQATDVKLQWSSASSSMFADDFYIADTAGAVNNDFLGAIKIECKFPSATGTTTQLTPTGAASNWDCVNDTNPDDDTTYVASATVGQLDTYAMQDMTATAGTIVGVQTGLRARKDDASVRQIAPEIRHAGTNYDGTAVTLTTSYANYYQVYETNPGTSVAWTISDINNMEAGVKIIA